MSRPLRPRQNRWSQRSKPPTPRPPTNRRRNPPQPRKRSCRPQPRLKPRLKLRLRPPGRPKPRKRQQSRSRIRNRRRPPEEAAAPPAAAAPDPTRGQQVFFQNSRNVWHGDTGQGGIGPTIAQTGFSVDQVLNQYRSPRGFMPASPASVIPDADVASVHAWLQTLPLPDVIVPGEGTP